MATMQLKLLGGFTVLVDGRAVDTPWRLRKARTLVKLLALAPGHQLHRDVLIDQLWPEADPDAGANNLHQALHAARRVLGADRLALRDELVVLGPAGDVVVDVDAFSTGAVDGSSSALAEVLSSWTGELLPEDLYEDWAAPHRERLAATRAGIALQVAAARTAEDDAAGAVEVLEPVALDRPADEDVHRALLAALVADGRLNEADAEYRRLTAALDDLGLPPSRATADLYRRLASGGSAVPATVPGNLPAFATTFVGRRRELRSLTTALERARLLTITGPGGAGKTRLALELARRQAASPLHPDGVWFVELAGVTDPRLVPTAVASSLDLSLAGDRPAPSALVDQLAGRHLLLVLDNCEHLLAAVSPLVGELLTRCPDLVVVATSREPLGLPGELAWRAPSLDLPTDAQATSPVELAEVESVALFLDRARTAAPGFTLDDTTAPAVAAICRRLDGIPLALELAAARLRHLSVRQVSERLDDALTVLAGRQRGVLDRQQTLAGTLDWSYELLTEDEQAVFRRLAVFAGGFDLAAAEAVCDDDLVLDLLGRLVDKSLVVADVGGEEARYRLHELVRQYAEVRLAEAGALDDARRRHRRWYADGASRRDPDRGEAVALEPSSWFDAEQDNLRAAVASALEEEACLALRLATSTWRFWMSRGQIADALGWLREALRGCDEVSPLRSRALFATGVLDIRRSDVEPLREVGEAIAAVEDAVGDEVSRAHAISQRAIFALLRQDWSQALEHSADAVSRADLDPSVAAAAFYFAGLLALGTGELHAARGHLAAASVAVAKVAPATPPFLSVVTPAITTDRRGPVPIPVGEDTLVLGRRVGAAQAAGYVAATVATVERLAGRVDEALGQLDDAAGRFEALGDVYGTAYAISQRAHTLRWAGELEGALDCFERAEELRSSLRDIRAVAMTGAGRAVVEAMLGRGAVARRHAAEATEAMRRSGDVPGTGLILNNAALVEAVLGNDEVAAAVATESLALGRRTVPLYALGWLLLLSAQLQTNLGQEDRARAATDEAAAVFAELADANGLAAVQRPRKAARITMAGG